MNILVSILLTVHLLVGLAIIGLVLIQHGKGADMGASFGSGASGSLFGATGSANFLSRSTAAAATVFFLCTLALAFMANSVSGRASGGSSVLDRAAPAASAPATGAIPGAAIPSTLPAAVAPAASAAASATGEIPKQ